MTALLHELRSPGARWLVVSGEPGTGKTRLLAELSARARAREHLVLGGCGSELERELPFGVWVAALDDHVAALGAERVAALVGDRAGELTQVLPSAGGDMPRGGLQDERFRAHRAVRALLGRLATQQPVVCTRSTTSTGLTTPRWSSSVHLLRRPAPARILTALAFRDGQLPAMVLAALEAATREGLVSELRLSPLLGRRGGRADGPRAPRFAA